MKILQIFNRYAYIGGEEIAVKQISKELALHHEFREITFDSQEWLVESGPLSRVRQFLSMAYHPAAINMVRKELLEFKPDIVLLHNIMPIGSAGLYVFLTGCGIPVVQFIHNFRPFSVNGYCWGNGKLLPQGLRQNFIPEIIARSWQNSRFKTAWYALLIWTLHRMGVYKKINGWIAISQFMKKSFVEGGIEEDRIAVISHSWQPQCTVDDLKKSANDDDQPVFLFLGRLTEEKGLRVLLDAWNVFEQSSKIGRLVIAGDGPLADEVSQRCETLQRASFVGFKTGEEKRQLLENCAALVVPSVWWEPLGLVLYEAYDHGKPVLAARSGGIVDHVEDGVTGWLHEPGDFKLLAAHMLEAVSNPENRQTRGINGRKLLLERSSSVWIDQFNEFVGKVIARARSEKSEVDEPSTKPCSGGVSPSHESATVIDRRYSEKSAAEESVFQSPSAQCFGEPVIVEEKSQSEAPSSNSKFKIQNSKFSSSSSFKIQNSTFKISISVYLADQNPGYDRSYGISRMTQIVLDTLQATGRVDIETISSKTSQQGSERFDSARILPWGTRRKWVRLLTDHLHPLFNRCDHDSDIYYFPKGYLPWLSGHCRPSVVTIHDTIIQYDEDHYPKWRKRWEYRYWAMILKHTLRKADRILTVSESSKAQIQAFMDRHQIPRKEITVTYEPCLYEEIPQPVEPAKENYVIHLASCEPHKRTAHLIRWWHEAEKSGKILPMLHLIGNVPEDVVPLLAGSRSLVKRPFLDDDALMAAYLQAKALILPSEIEGFGLPALEAYYLGTPVCFVEGTSVEEILAVATSKGKFSLEDAQSLFTALDEVMAMSADEVRECGLKLRNTYTAKNVVERMVSVFHEVKN